MQKKSKKKKLRPVSIQPPHDSPFHFSILPSLRTKNYSLLNSAREKLKAFQKIKTPLLHYEAFYYGGKNIWIYPTVSNNSKGEMYIVPYPNYTKHTKFIPIKDIPKLSGKGIENSWEEFCSEASFGSILQPMAEEHNTDPCTDEEISNVLEKENDGFVEWQKSGRPGTEDFRGHIAKEDKLLLRLVRDKPYALRNIEIRDRFIDILTTARWCTIQEIRNEAKESLVQNLLPKKHPGGFKPLPNVDYKLAIELLNYLAKHLSTQCKTASKGMGIEISEYLTEASLNLLTENHYDRRLVSLTQKELRTLISAPVKFVENLIKFQLSSTVKTLKNRNHN